MADKFVEHMFCKGASDEYDAESGPIIHCSANKGDVVISWPTPHANYMKLLEIVPPITDWNELDGDMYAIGKIVMEHFLTEDKDQ